MILSKREYRFPLKDRLEYPAFKAFYMPQREHPKTPMPKRAS